MVNIDKVVIYCIYVAVHVKLELHVLFNVVVSKTTHNYMLNNSYHFSIRNTLNDVYLILKKGC